MRHNTENRYNNMSIATVVGLLILGVIAGVLSSMVGIGGGIVIVPALVLGFGLAQHTAQGTTLAMLSIPVALASVINYHKAGHVNWQFVIWLCVGFAVGGYFGSQVALQIPVKTIKRVFACVLIVVAAKMFWDSK
ncbi:MAG: hypothetical protein RL660_1183 [Bacteroidota bacterium]|jgi:uncharacterized membrane protein YfcA